MMTVTLPKTTISELLSKLELILKEEFPPITFSSYNEEENYMVVMFEVEDELDALKQVHDELSYIVGTRDKEGKLASLDICFVDDTLEEINTILSKMILNA